MGHLEAGMFVGDADEFAPGVTGSTEDRDGMAHVLSKVLSKVLAKAENIRICRTICELARLAPLPATAKIGPVTGIAAAVHLPNLVLAHQFGWDEILLFVVPVALALVAVRWFEKRSNRGAADEDEGDDAGD